MSAMGEKSMSRIGWRKVRGLRVMLQSAAENNGVAVVRLPGSRFCISASTPTKTIYDQYVSTYDTAYPAPWAENEYYKFGRTVPRCVWSYDTNDIFGEPVFLDDLLYKLGQECEAVLEGLWENEHVQTTQTLHRVSQADG